VVVVVVVDIDAFVNTLLIIDSLEKGGVIVRERCKSWVMVSRSRGLGGVLVTWHTSRSWECKGMTLWTYPLIPKLLMTSPKPYNVP
jgi:hypothetical protein